ncbi:MAG: hypothetical protein AB8E74_06650 [Prochlorococcus sp.]
MNLLLCSKRKLSIIMLLAMFPVATRAYGAYGGFTDLDQVGPWKIERKIDPAGEIQCRAYLPSGGTWFGANIHLDRSNALVVPMGQDLNSNASIEKVIIHLKHCREDLLYITPIEG